MKLKNWKFIFININETEKIEIIFIHINETEIAWLCCFNWDLSVASSQCRTSLFCLPIKKYLQYTFQKNGKFSSTFRYEIIRKSPFLVLTKGNVQKWRFSTHSNMATGRTWIHMGLIIHGSKAIDKVFERVYVRNWEEKVTKSNLWKDFVLNIGRGKIWKYHA